jgi:polyferredoxin
MSMNTFITAGTLLFVHRRAPRPMLLLERFIPGLGWIEIAVPLAFRFYKVPALIATIFAASFGVIGVLIMFVFSYLRGQMVHCTTYCPIGALAVILGRCNPFHLRIHRPTCNECGICTYACRYGALCREDLKRGKAGLNCVLCGDCLSACPRGIDSSISGSGQKGCVAVLRVSGCQSAHAFHRPRTNLKP